VCFPFPQGINALIKIALIQQRVVYDRQANLDQGVCAFKQAAQSKAQLIVFPELAFQTFFPQHRGNEGRRSASFWAETIPGPTTDLFCRLAADLGVVTILNLYEKKGNLRFDSSPVIDTDGSLLGVTRMIHVMDGPGFHERDYYDPGDQGAPVYTTALGKVGVAICYDRHFPEYMRALGLKGADIVAIPQAGAVGEWPPGLYEAELQVASMQNGYFCALANRVGEEERLVFAGESFVTDPLGQVVSRAPTGHDHILYAELDTDLLARCPARQHFLPDRRPDVYPL
jgi:N-carbamoylputrescine amidase